MLELELNVKIQASKETEEQVAEAFAVALEAYAAAIRKGIPKHLPIKGDDVNAILEVQATTSYINSIERNVLIDIQKAKTKLASPNLSATDKKAWEAVLGDLEETLGMMRDGEQGESIIRMYDHPGEGSPHHP